MTPPPLDNILSKVGTSTISLAGKKDSFRKSKTLPANLNAGKKDSFGREEAASTENPSADIAHTDSAMSISRSSLTAYVYLHVYLFL